MDNKESEKESLKTRWGLIWKESRLRSDGSFWRAVFILVKEQILCRFGTSRIDYFTCDLYKLGWLGRREFINGRRAKYIRNVCNDKEKTCLFRDKSLFNATFRDYVCRDWIDLRNADKEEFYKFIGTHTEFMVKPQFLDGGRGIYKQTVKEDTDTDKLYSELKKEESLLEEVIVQCDELAGFNSASVNTVRIVTLIDADNEVHIMSGVLRMGTEDNCADNFHTNGIAATVDVDTGIVVSSAVSRDLARYYVHPQSHKQIIGYTVPMWQEMINTVKRAAAVVPEVRYVGWDIALNSKNEIVLIEGNDNAARDVQQMPDLKGKWLMYKPIVKKIKQIK